MIRLMISLGCEKGAPGVRARLAAVDHFRHMEPL